MATVMYINGKEQSKAGMKSAIEYVGKDSKTMLKIEDGTAIKLVSGQNVTPETAYEEFIATKETFGKTDKRQFYHVVQSFSPDEEIEPEGVHEAGVRLAKYFDGYEVLIATHIDRDHHHNHLIINSVNAQTGKKFSEGIKGIYELRRYSDNICKYMKLSVLPDKEKSDVKGMKTGEFRVAHKGDSWKFRLIGIIDDAMARTQTKAEFINYMKNQGYSVTWTNTRKSITYTSPNGMKVRDNKLHEEKYLKERMEEYYGLGSYETEKQGRGNHTQTISADNLCDTTGTMGSNDEIDAEYSKWADGASQTSKTTPNNKGNGRNVAQELDEHTVCLGRGNSEQTSGSVKNADKISEGGNSTNKRTNSDCQNKHIRYNNQKQQHAPDKNNISNEHFASSVKNILEVDNNDYVKITCDNTDLSHLKGNELHMAIKNLEDQSESIKARNERAEEDKKSAKYLDMTLTMIEDMYNSKDEEELEL